MADERTTAERYAYAYGSLAQSVQFQLDSLRKLLQEFEGPVSSRPKGALIMVIRRLEGTLEMADKSLQPGLAQHEIDGRHDAHA